MKDKVLVSNYLEDGNITTKVSFENYHLDDDDKITGSITIEFFEEDYDYLHHILDDIKCILF